MNTALAIAALAAGSILGQKIGVWEISIPHPDFGRIVAEGSGESDLVKFCSVKLKACVLGIYSEFPCEEGKKYKGKLSTEAATKDVEFQCLGDSEDPLQTLAFADYTAANELLAVSQRATVALPDGKAGVIVYSFPLEGYVEASMRMETAVLKASFSKDHKIEL